MKQMSRAAVAAAMVAAVLGVSTSTAGAVPTWAPEASATVHPGVQTFTDGAQCTANFVFYDATDVYIGQAAHCSGTGAATETNGCDSATLPVGTEVEIDGASRPGTMVYNSWATMQTAEETDVNACSYNDFALIRIHPDDRDVVNPSIPFWGGPSGGFAPATAAGDEVHSYGNSSLRLGIELLSPKTGFSLGTSGDGWTHAVYTLTPGIPGDSGSAFIDGQGRALGVLSTLALAPLPASNNVSDIGKAVAYMEAHTNIDVTLAEGTAAFGGGLLG